MNVDTPFPDRLPTPFWSPRGSLGMGDYTLADGTPCDPSQYGAACQDTTARILQAIATGTGAAARSLSTPTGPSSFVNCPAGTIYNPASLTCQPGVGVQASASGSGVLLILILLGGLFFLGRQR